MVVDGNDHGGIVGVKAELDRLLQEDALRSAALLVFANKQDLPNAMPTPEVTEKLGMNGIQNRKWCIQSACGTTGDGLYKGLDWLTKAIAGK